MSYTTSLTRTEIARDLLAAMLHGVCSAQVNPLFLKEYADGIHTAPKLAVALTEKLIAELDATEKP